MRNQTSESPQASSLTPLWQWVPRRPVKKSAKVWAAGLQRKLHCPLWESRQPSSCSIPLTSKSARNQRPRGLSQRGWGKVGSKPEATEASGAPPTLTSPRLGVFAVSPAGAGAARSQSVRFKCIKTLKSFIRFHK